jgi:membrane fusion protein (multidrug efflux system)
VGGCAEPESAQSAPAPDPGVAVELYQVLPEAVVDEVALTGQLEAADKVFLKSEIAGVISSIHFEEGARVEAGDVLFRLDDREQRARLAEAQAEQRLAQDVYDRTQTLTSRDVSSLARKTEAAAELDKAMARTELARLQLDRTRIRAPFDGVVGVRLVAPGSRVEDEIPLVELVAIQRLQALFTIQERYVPLARVGLPIHVRVAAYPGERFPGEVFFVAPSLDAAARRLILKAWIQNEDHRLKPGMFVNVDVEIAAKDDALMVPETAIVYDSHGVFVWRQGAEGKAEKIPVELGLRQEGRVEIAAGVSPGDVIVSAGVHKVMAGKRLRDPRTRKDTTVHALEGRTGSSGEDGAS